MSNRKDKNIKNVIFLDGLSSKNRIISYIKPIKKIDIADKADEIFYKLIKTKIKWSKASD